MSDTHKNNQDHYRSEASNCRNDPPSAKKQDDFYRWVYAQADGNYQQPPVTGQHKDSF